MKLVKLFKSNIMRKDRLLRVLLMLQLTVTIMVTMNLSESLDRYMGASGSVRVGRYLYEKNYDIYSDLLYGLLRLYVDERKPSVSS